MCRRRWSLSENISALAHHCQDLIDLRAIGRLTAISNTTSVGLLAVSLNRSPTEVDGSIALVKLIQVSTTSSTYTGLTGSLVDG